MEVPSIANALRRSLLIKIISKPQPSREDVASVIELTASKVVEALQAQSMTMYLVEGNDIVFKQIYYSPTLWVDDPKKEEDVQGNGVEAPSAEDPGRHRDCRQGDPDRRARVFPQYREPGADDDVDWPGRPASR